MRLAWPGVGGSRSQPLSTPGLHPWDRKALLCASTPQQCHHAGITPQHSTFPGLPSISCGRAGGRGCTAVKVSLPGNVDQDSRENAAAHSAARRLPAPGRHPHLTLATMTQTQNLSAYRSRSPKVTNAPER